MNKVYLSGIIQNIRTSHSINNIEYNKADLIVTRANRKEDIISIRFKRYSNKYHDGDKVYLVGNLRSYSTNVDGKNKVEMYVFTYFDKPETNINENNLVLLDGRICKLNPQQIDPSNPSKKSTQFILANNIIKNNHKINNYINCISFGEISDYISSLNTSDKIQVKGEIHSHFYKKAINEEEYEIKIAHELIIKEIIKGDLDDNKN